MNELEMAIKGLLTYENPLKVGNVTFTNHGPLGIGFDMLPNEWEVSNIAKNIILKLKKHKIIKSKTKGQRNEIDPNRLEENLGEV